MVLKHHESIPPNLVDLLRHRAQQHPNDHAYAWISDADAPEQTVTYGEVDRASRAIAAMLMAEGATGQRALLLYPPGLEYIAAYFGCLYAGVIAVPAYPPRLNRPSPRLAAIVEDAQATFALTTTPILQKLQARFVDTPALAALTWHTTDGMDLQHADAWKPWTPTSETVAFLQYTSGTTAPPRGVRVTHGNLLANSALIAAGFSHTVADRGVFWLPIYHDMGLIGGVLQPLWIGRPTTLMPPAAFLQSPYRWLKAISRLKANVSGGPDMAYDLCARQVTAEQKATLDLSHWELAFTGAEPIRADTLRRFTQAFEPCGFRASTFYPCYGGAESTLIITGGTRQVAPAVRRLKRAELEAGTAVDAGPDDNAVETVGCGKALGGQELRVVDPVTHVTCADNVVGEVWLKGPCVAPGYWRQEEKTRHTFGGMTAEGAGPFLRTNDLGFLDRGELFFVSRYSDVLRVNQRVVYPHDLENVTQVACASLRAGFGAAFVAVVDGTPRLVLAAELERRAKADVETILPVVQAAVEKAFGLRLDALVLVRMLGLPKTSSGKIQRYAAREEFLAGTLDAAAQWTLWGGTQVFARGTRTDDAD